MTEPYFTDGQVTLYHGDCREVTEWLTADILVTDPPYGRNWKQGNGMPAHGRRAPRQRDHSHNGIPGDHDTETRDTILRMWGPKRLAIVFGDLMLPPPAGTKQVLVYRKPGDAGTRGATAGFRRDLEAIYLLGPWPSGIGGRSSVLATSARAQGSDHGVAARAGHPHAKPLDVMQELLAACPPGVIADPCAGSCSTLLAARHMGWRGVGVELVEADVRNAVKRLSQGVLHYGIETADA
jgi:hypothetical protein